MKSEAEKQEEVKRGPKREEERPGVLLVDTKMKGYAKKALEQVHRLMAFFVPPNSSVDTYTRALVLVFLCFTMGFAKFASMLQVLVQQKGPTFLTYGIFVFWMQMMLIPFFIKRKNSLYILSHYTLALLYVGALYSTYSGYGYTIVNCTVFPILPLTATFLFGTFWDSLAWCVLLLVTNIGFFMFKSEWEPGRFPSVAQLNNFIFFANMTSMSISTILGGVFNFSNYIKQKELERERDKAQELSQIKSEFTANVSHEIRTPLVAVIGLSELLAKDTMLTSDQRYLINTIYSASLHLDNLVNNVLNFSKTEANMAQLDRTQFDVSELVEETLLYFSAMAESSGIRLLSFIDPISTDGLCHVMGDPHRIQQILQNLVANAIKFCAESAQGEVLITLDTIPSRVDANGRVYRFSVADNGIGMSKAGLQKLFQPFSQCDNSTTRRYGGTGLGLVICKQLCTLLGGDIEVDSEEGKGTTITFTLPLEPSEHPELAVHEHEHSQRKRETMAAAEAAAKAAASAADAAEEAELEAGHAAKVAAQAMTLTPNERRAAATTATAAKETMRAAKATADAAHTTAEAASAAAEAFAEGTPNASPGSSPDQNNSNPNTPKRGLQVQTEFPSPRASPHTSPPFQPSPLRHPMQLTKPMPKGELEEKAMLMEEEMVVKSLELDPTEKEKKPKGKYEEETEKGEETEEDEGEKKHKDTEKEPLISSSTENLEDKARVLSRLAKDFIGNAASWEIPKKQEGSNTPESPFSQQMRNTLDDIQKILRQSEKDRKKDMRTIKEEPNELRNANSPSLMRTESAPTPDSYNPFLKEASASPAPSPVIEGTRHGRSKSVSSGLNSPFSSRMFIPTSAQDPTFNLSPTTHTARVKHTADKRVSGGMVTSSTRTPLFSPDFQKILTKSQEFWTSSTGSISGEMRRGTTGYLEPINDTRVAWSRIREGMRINADTPQGNTICVLAGSQGAREVIKSSLLFRGLANTEVMDGEEYAQLLKLANPPRFRVVIAEADLFARMETDGLRDSAERRELAEVLDPAIFDPRICTRYILLISCKYHRFGKYIEFAVPPEIAGDSEDTVKVVFCANNPVRRSSLAQSLLACVAPSEPPGEDGKKTENVNSPRGDAPSPPQTSRSGLRILLCEDNQVNIEVLTRQLKRLGYTNCDIKHNGADGVEAFKEKDYDIVLMDCQMPVLDGYEATKMIRKIEQERKSKKRVPIVALTASAMPEERERGMKSGMDNYLSKPIQLAVLQNILEGVQAT